MPIEIALKEAGVDMVGQIGKSLLKRLIEHGHSNRSIIAIKFNKSPYFENGWWDIKDMNFGINGLQLATVYLDKDRKYCWHVCAWEEDETEEDPDPCIVYSEYDLLGKRVIGV